MVKKKISLEDALKDFAQAMNDAAKILVDDIKNFTASESDADDEDDEEEEDAPSKSKAAPAKGKKAAVEDDDEDEAEDDEDETPAPKKGKGKKDAEDDEEEDEDGEEAEIEYSAVQKAVAKAAKANGRDFVAAALKQVGGKKCDHASKLKAEQYADFIEALSEEADED